MIPSSSRLGLLLRHALSPSVVGALVRSIWGMAALLVLGAAIPAQVQPDWMPAPVLGGKKGHAMAYDSARQRTVLFGGYGDAATWEWDGSRWAQRWTSIRPEPRVSATMAYDAARKRVVMFGGQAPQAPYASLSDTWEWDGERWWQRSVAAAPPARFGHAMVFDLARRRVVLYGGEAPSGALADTWEWDGTAWSQRLASSPPGARSGHAMSYDLARQAVVLFGGGNSTSSASGTWVWNGSAWIDASPPAMPGARMGHQMAYDVVRQRTVLFGGADWNWPWPSFADTWEWDGRSWTLRTPPLSPAARNGMAMAYDLARQRLVLSGGQDDRGRPYADTWEWDGTTWSLRSQPASMSTRYGAAMAYDAARQRVVLFGGAIAGGVPTFFADTWEWDGSAWHDRTPTGGNPPGREGHAMAYDVARQRVVLFGGIAGPTTFGDTWEWDGSRWTQYSPATAPSPRTYFAMAYDPIRRTVVAFGGSDGQLVTYSDTWEWNGSTWTQLPSSPSPGLRSGHEMATDLLRQRIVLFGGANRSGWFADTWEWNGAWTKQSPLVSPTARAGHGMVYDLARQRSVLFGGADSSWNALRDTWEWDGSSWLRVAITTDPNGVFAKPAYDAARQRIVTVAHPNITWLYGPLTPATSQAVGSGCTGTNGVPLLTSNEPYLGCPALRLQLHAAAPKSACAFALAGLPANVPLGGGCSLYVSSPILALPSVTGGLGFVDGPPFAVPFDVLLRGAPLYAQAVVVDAAAPVLSLSFSAGRKLVLGD